MFSGLTTLTLSHSVSDGFDLLAKLAVDDSLAPRTRTVVRLELAGKRLYVDVTFSNYQESPSGGSIMFMRGIATRGDEKAALNRDGFAFGLPSTVVSWAGLASMKPV